jgi:hypothetical protein
LVACTLNPSGPACPYFWNWVRNTRGDYNTAAWSYGSSGPSYLPWLYIFNDPGQTAAPPTATQFAFKTPDISYAQCSTTFGSGTCVQNQVWQAIVSKSSWAANATQMLIKAGWEATGQDHTAGYQQGAYHIYRNGAYLLSGDSPGFNSVYSSDCTISIGGAAKWNDTSGYAPVARWAGSDPWGPASSSYMYTMVDLTPSYTAGANATRANRHIVHFKKASNQDYILTYDDVALSAGAPIDAYWHYQLNGNPYTAVTYNGAARTVVNKQASSLLNSQFLAVEGSTSLALVVDNPNGTYAGGMGTTFRATACASADGATCNASATAFESLVVQEPCNGKSCAMPPITQPNCTGTGGNCTAVQVADKGSAKVAVFARQGALLAGAGFTTTHSGTAQYVLAGFKPGTYQVTVNGVAVPGNGLVVSANDNSMEFESGSGTVNISPAVPR